MQLIIALEFGGAESLGLTISRLLQAKTSCNSSICAFYGRKGPLAEVAAGHGVTARFLDAQNRGRVKAMYDLHQMLKQEQVNVVQVHGAYLLQFVVFPALLAGAKVVYTEHAKHSILKYPRLRRQARILSLLCSKVVCVSHNLKQFMVNDVGVKPSRIEVIHNGVDLERFTALELGQNRNNPNELVIGTVARLTEAKNHGNLLRAFALVREKVPHARLVLVGDGELRGDIQAMIHDLGLETSVDLLGKLSDIPKQLANMDIFVLPSKREGFPVSIIEAMACARPVVATDVGGVREIISNGEDGIIVPPEDHSSLATALLQLAQDFGLRERLGSYARLKAVEQFSEQAMVERYQDLFAYAGGHIAQ